MVQDVDSRTRFGYVAEEVDPTLDLFAEIERLKQEHNAVILAHYYQDPDIQDVADFVGDSLALSQQAAATDAEVILFAGVHFMAETAKLLSPEKKVLLPDLNAGCSLSESCPAPLFAEFKKKYPEHTVISYVNCSAGLKALTDIVVTSTNAVPIVQSLPADEKIIFAPDKNLGRYVMRETGRDMVLWDGACMVHEIFSHRKIQALKTEHPQALLIAHPECEEAVLQLADVIGSTSKLLRTVQENHAQEFIVATEPGILHAMKKAAPQKRLIPAPAHSSCACNNCPHMKLNTLEKLYLALKHQPRKWCWILLLPSVPASPLTGCSK